MFNLELARYLFGNFILSLLYTVGCSLGQIWVYSYDSIVCQLTCIMLYLCLVKVKVGKQEVLKQNLNRYIRTEKIDAETCFHELEKKTKTKNLKGLKI